MATKLTVAEAVDKKVKLTSLYKLCLYYKRK